MKILLSMFLLFSFSVQAKSFKSMFNSFVKEQTKTTSPKHSKNDNEVSGSFLEIKNPPEGNHGVKDFNAAKAIMKKTHYMGATKTIYCGCEMTAWNRFSYEKCSFKPKNDGKYQSLLNNIEVEHLLPFSQILSGTKAYREGEPSVCGKYKGRKCADKVYGFLAGDLYILSPAEAILNRIHSDYQWAELGNQGEQWGTCDFYYSDKKVQPPQSLKGKIARAYMYVQSIYKVKVISGKNEKLFEIWAKYPPTKDQCDVTKNIVKIQGNENKFEINACKEANLW